MLLISGATNTMNALKGQPYLGRFITPETNDAVKSFEGWQFAADNGCFKEYNPKKILNLLRKLKNSHCLWFNAPDVVEDATKTLELFEEWHPIIREHNLPVAFTGQNGCEDQQLPWNKFDCFFIGGSTQWKIGEAAATLAQQAKSKGKWLHMGRVNTKKRIEIAAKFGCHSIDGSGFSIFPPKITLGLKWIQQALEG